jgi:GABA(A) receptor-associated protein
MPHYRNETSLEQRTLEAKNILCKHPDRVPIIVEISDKSTLPELDKKKYLVPKDLTMGQFMIVIRKRIKLSPEKALFMFINNTLPSSSQLIGQIYDTSKNDDGFMYITITSESTFG